MKLGYSTIINVTKEDILKGSPEGSSCPIALAVKKAFKLKKSEEIFVSKKSITVNDITFKAPPEVKKFITLFDKCFDENTDILIDKERLNKIAPIKFELSL